MIDLNNTWCESTEENYNKLKNMGFLLNCNENKSELEIMKEKYESGEYICIAKPLIKNSIWSRYTPFEFPNGNIYKLIHKKHEAILESYLKDNKIDIEVVYLLENSSNSVICLNFLESYDEKLEYRLKPIKKEWYENPDNFPCIVISLKTNKPHIAYNYNHFEEKIKQETFSAKPDKFRPATKEEVLSLLVKE